jgi:hypothetical protein
MSGRRAAAWRAWARQVPALIGLLCVLAACTGGAEPALPRSPVTVASGPPGGVYEIYGRAYAAEISRRFPGVQAQAINSDGSVENLHRVASGTATVGFALADSAGDALAGRASFREALRVSALARIYDNFVQLVVLAEDGPKNLGELRGKRVSIGAAESGTAVMARRILRLTGLAGSVQTTPLVIGESVTALRRGEIAAFFWVGGLPTPAISRLQQTTPLRLLDLGEVSGALAREYGDFYLETRVPAVAYGMAGSVATVSVPIYLVVREDLETDVAYWLTRTLFESQDRLVDAHPEARALDLRSAIATAALSLHPGAERYYREVHD